MILINVGLSCVPQARQGHGKDSTGCNPRNSLRWLWGGGSFSRPSLNTRRVRRPLCSETYHQQGYISLVRGPAILYCVSRNVVRDRRLNLMFVEYIISDIVSGKKKAPQLVPQRIRPTNSPTINMTVISALGRNYTCTYSTLRMITEMGFI